MTIAITGATGQLGRLVVEQLQATAPAHDIIGLARTPEKAASLGVMAREADYDRPATLDSALVGVDTLLLISGPARRPAPQRDRGGEAGRGGTNRLHECAARRHLAAQYRPRPPRSGG